MEHQDVEMSDIVVVADDGALGKLDEWVATLKAAGVFIEDVDHDNGVVEGTIASALIRTIEKIACVKYVRSVFNYVAESPGGESRDMDEDDRGDEHILR
jgi:hypothetical protein